MKTITLTNGEKTLVSDCDYTYLKQWKWGYHKTHGRNGKPGRGGYAVRTTEGSNGRPAIHQVIANRMKLKGQQIDHRNRNKLDNQRCNLRCASFSQQTANEDLRRDNKSGFRGVYWHYHYKLWVANIRVNGKLLVLGFEKSKIKAARLYNKAARKHFGKFARLNKI